MPSKTPERHDPQDHTIQFDVPYIYMKDRNDCWKAALSMLYQFVTFLHSHGPALVVLPDNDQADHAQVLTGISGGEVLLNNPAEDPHKQDLSVQTSGNAVARLHR